MNPSKKECAPAARVPAAGYRPDANIRTQDITPPTAPRTNSIPDNLRVYQIPAAPGHDPITVYVEAIAPGQSRIIVRHYASSWTAYWGAHGHDITVEKFICNCNIDYIADNLAWGLYGWLRRDGEKRMTVLLKKIAGAMQNHFKESGAAN